MKEKQNTAAWLNGNITVELSKTKTASTVLFRFFALLLIILTALHTANMAIEMPLDVTVLAFALPIALGFTFMYDLKEYRIYFILASFIILALVLLYFRVELLYGIQIIRSNFMKSYNKYFSTNFITYDVRIPIMKEYIAAKSMVMIVISYIISLYFGYFLKRGTATVSALIFMLPLFWILVNFGDNPNALLIMLVFFSFLFIFALESRIKYSKKEGGVFSQKYKRRKTIYTYSIGYIREKAVANEVLTTLCIAVIIIAMIMMIFPKNSYSTPQRIKEISQNPMSFVEELRDKLNIDGIIIEGLGGFGSESGIGAGNLQQIDRPVGDGTKVHLKVKAVSYKQEGFPEFNINYDDALKPMLLKGYIGSLYTGNSWEDLPAEVYKENSKLFLDFYLKKIPLPYLFTEMIGLQQTDSINESFVSDLINFNAVEIENVGANKKFAYVPYGFVNLLKDDYLTPISPTHSDYDRNIIAANLSNPYRMLTGMTANLSYGGVFENFNNFATMYRHIDDNTFKRYLGDEIAALFNSYSDFAYKNYLQMPENGLEEIKNYFIPYKDKSQIDYAIAIMLVEDYLNKHAVYDLSPGSVPSGKDYIEYFLYENHRGYCSNFASAATMMFRSLGIPARYVEGYTLTQYDIDFKTDSNGNTLISDSNAHAWTEIFADNIGWIPVDVTPGFSGEKIAEQVTNPPIPEEIVNSTPPVSSEQISESKPQTSSEIISSTPVPSGGESNSNNTSSESSIATNKPSSKVTAALLYSLSALLIFVLIIILIRSIAFSMRNKHINQIDKNKAVIVIYKLVTKILAFIGCQRSTSESELGFAERMTAECDYITDDSYILLTEQAQKAYFSKHKITSAEWEKSKAYLTSFSKKIYSEQSIVKKLIFWLKMQI